MRILSLLVYLTTFFVFIQLLTGGLITLYDIPSGHALIGLAVAVLALASLIFAFISKPTYLPLKLSCLSAFVLVLLAGLTSDKTMAFLHYTLALLAFGTLMATTFYVVRWSATTSS